MMDRWREFVKAAESDDWTQMPDARDRKRAQNRLAQRAHRRRLQQRSGSDDGTNIQQPAAIAVEDSIVVNPTLSNQNWSSSQQAKRRKASGRRIASQSSAGSIIIPERLSSHMTLPGFNTLAALLTNAHILGIDCETSPRAKIIHVPSSVLTPPALTPTVLQSSQPHLPYVDLLPFSSLRDNLLKADGMIVAAEMWSDIVEGGIQVWGQTPWDIRGWEVQEHFAIKWWWLMSNDIMAEANFWRVSRGENPLILDDIKTSLTRRTITV